MGPPFERSREPLPDFLWLNSMVYGRYNELVNGGYFMVYKPTNITGGPHPAACGDISCMAMCGSDT